MKRLLLVAVLAAVACAGTATPSYAGTFGLFYCSKCCDCGALMVRPYNAFTPIACGDLHACPCPVPVACNNPYPPPFDCHGCKGCRFGGKCKHGWHGGEVLGGEVIDGQVIGGVVDGCPVEAGSGQPATSPAPAGPPQAAPAGPDKQPPAANPAGPRNMALFHPASLTWGEVPGNLMQPACHQCLVGYGCGPYGCSAQAAPPPPPAPPMPQAPAWNYGYGYGYGYSPSYPQPMYNPAMWAPQAYPAQGYYPYAW
jgi:hypothetical protein